MLVRGQESQWSKIFILNLDISIKKINTLARGKECVLKLSEIAGQQF